jgi:hypothetical protein
VKSLFGLTVIILAAAPLTQAQSTSNCVACMPGLVSLWSAEGNGDDSWGTNNGSLQGGISFVPSPDGEAFALNGAGGYVQVPYSVTLDPGKGSFTVSAWINTLSTNSACVLIKYALGGLGSGGASLFDLFLISGGKPKFEIRDQNGTLGGPYGQPVYGPRSIADGQYHHLAGGRDTNNRTIFLSVDGVKVSNQTGFTNSVFGDGETAPLFIGAQYFCCGTGLGAWFDGAIDEVAYFNRALSDNELRTLAGWPKLTLKGTTNGGLMLEGLIGFSYRIEYSDSIVTYGVWNTLTNLVLPVSPLSLDVTFTQASRRFYRAARN